MSNLLEQYQGHNVFQTLNNKLDEINNALQSDSYNEVQIENLLAYQQLLSMIQTNLNTRSLPMVPVTILNNLNNAIQNLHISYLIDMNNNYQYFQQLMDNYRRIPNVEKKSEIKESFNSLIDRFIKNKEKITSEINLELKNFKAEQVNQIKEWQSEKETMQEEINELKEQNENLKTQIEKFEKEINNQKTKINTLIENFQSQYNDNTKDFETRFLEKEKEYDKKNDDLLNAQRNCANEVLEHLEKRREEIEKLWGIIGQAAISGNSQNYANKAKMLADIMMWVTLGIMLLVVAVLSITTIIDLYKGSFNYVHFMYKIIGSTIFLVPAFYCSNISKRHRDREFQLRDFEVKTAALEPFMENMILESEQTSENDINKDKVKLELTKAFFSQQFNNGNNSNECILIPKEIAKILNTVAKKCNLNINLGDKHE